MDSSFSEIFQVISRQFNSEHYGQQLLSQMQAGKLEKFMNERKNDPLSDILDALVSKINLIVLLFYDGTHSERNKMNFLREAVNKY